MGVRFLAATSALALVTTVVHAGGWGIVTVEHVPRYAVAGRQIALTYTIRGHGQSISSFIDTDVDARLGRDTVRGAATAGSNPLYPIATITLPRPGPWPVSLRAGGKVAAGNSYAVAEFPLQVVDSGSEPPVISDVDRGTQLFTAKGCAGCHVRESWGPHQIRSSQIGPTLNGKRYQPDWLRQQLANPKTKPTTSNDWGMPNLNLKEEEISALVAFLNQPESHTSRR